MLVAGAGVVGIAMWLRQRDWLWASAIAFLVLLITVIHTLCATGEGIHDTATMLYPLAILVAALMLDRRLLVAVTLACIASVAILVALHPSGPREWADIFDVAIILVVKQTSTRSVPSSSITSNLRSARPNAWVLWGSGMPSKSRKGWNRKISSP